MAIDPERRNFLAAGFPTLIGSLPLTSHHEALRQILTHTPEIPLWPQLPSNPLERMTNQFNEGIPGIVEEEDRTYFNIGTETFEAEMLSFFEEYLAVTEDISKLADSRFQVSRERAGGIYHLVDELTGKADIRAVKGQVTGPFTLLTGIADQEKRLGYYDPTIREMSVKGIAMKAAWQVQFLSRLNKPVLLFIDEPALAGLGSSSYISISKDDIAQDLEEVINAVHLTGGLAGVHVCANTDWNFLLSTNLDIVSFDAFGFFDRFVTSKEKIYAYLNRGGIIAWGIVPTSEAEDIENATSDGLATLWEEQAGKLLSDTWSLQALLNQTLITPSCGTGSIAPDLAKRVLTLTQEVSAILREKYGE